ncbi:MAG: AI-2E family transporter [Propionibacteriales bacterium]|nr:AI-2E family transporter [Propionibacteriales bacterium]
MSTPRVRDRAVVIDEAFATMQRWGLRVVVVAAALFVLGWVVGSLWMVFFPLSIALLVATVLSPPVSWLRRHKVPSTLAALIVMLTFLGVVVATIAILTPQVAGQAPAIAKQASGGLQEVRNWLTDGPLSLSDGQITRAIAAVQDRLQDSAAAISSGIFSTLSAATNAVLNLVLILMLTFFFIKDGHRFLPWLTTLGGHRAGAHLSELLGRVWGTIGGFIRTQSLVAFIDAVLIGIGLAILGVPLAIPLAVITFFGGFIPIIGAFASGILAVLVTLVTNDFKAAVIAALIVIGVQQLEGNVLSPWLQGKTMNLHAGVVLMSVTAGGTLFGVTGAFLAVPVAAASAELFRYLNEQVDRSVDPQAPTEDKHAADLLAEGRTALDPD